MSGSGGCSKLLNRCWMNSLMSTTDVGLVGWKYNQARGVCEQVSIGNGHSSHTYLLDNNEG